MVHLSKSYSDRYSQQCNYKLRRVTVMTSVRQGRKSHDGAHVRVAAVKFVTASIFSDMFAFTHIEAKLAYLLKHFDFMGNEPR